MRTGVQAILPQWAGGRLRWYPTRWGTPIVAVVVHKMDGSLEGTDSWFRNPASGIASTHFGIGLWNGVPQIRQWVPTEYTAYGWAARPTSTPTALARNVLGTRGLYSGSHDLNRNVIHIEVEGWASQYWPSSSISLMRTLLARIAAAHGRLVLMAHTDLSWKPCPGMATTPWAAIGGYGGRIGSTPVPAPTPPPVTGGGQINMLLRPVQEQWYTRTGTTSGFFFTHGPNAGTRKAFYARTRVTSIAESVDGQWRVLAYGREILWMPRTNLTPIAGTRRPASGYAPPA